MARIYILPDHVANQIAAGEVIERPAAAVKELIENSLDAEASHIEVEFRHGGKSYLRVEDDGIGMTPDEALLSLERHATSKLREAKDLQKIRSFGFRGEAIPSIASVSRFTLQTRARATAIGTEIFVNGGAPIHQRDHGMPEGTRITVEHLFNSVPARRKFLRTDATEAAHIIQCVRLYAAANPAVSFRLLEDGREIFRSPKNAQLIDRVCTIWGARLRGDLLALEPAKEDDLRLWGLLGRPGAVRATRAETLFFVNGRPADCRALTYALLEAYRTRIPQGKYPPAFLFFEADPSRVDVNVHPAKREIRLRDEFRIRNFITKTVLAALEDGIEETSEFVPAEALRPQIPVRAVYEPYRPIPSINLPIPEKADNVSTSAQRAATPQLQWRLIGLWRQPYWLFDTPGGLVLLNTRAAHRRIWYERLRRRTEAWPSQSLLAPALLSFDPIASNALQENINLLEQQGFSIEPFGGSDWRLHAVPTWLELSQAEVFVQETVALLREQAHGLSPDARLDAFAKIASQRAVRRDDHLSPEGAYALVAQLMKCENPLTCPLGKPTYIEFPAGDLEKRFL